MKRGLVIGKFMPVHRGHVALIGFAAAQCDELIVSMSFTQDDPIDYTLRYAWLTELFKENPSIKVEISLDDFDSPELPLEERTRIWAEFIKKRFPKIDVLFSSEEYGDPFAGHLGIPHVSFDPARTAIPVSATRIRNEPLKYWDLIPNAARPYFVRKICFYGPESTGKSTLAAEFAKRYQTEWVPEVARELITSNHFTVDDIIRIGHAQTERVLEKTRTANRFVFCDTDLITTEIYSRHYLGYVPPVLYELEASVKYDLYFLLDVDVPWIADGLRDLGGKRKEMYDLFETELKKRSVPFVAVKGSWDRRIEIIVRALEKFR